MLPTRPVEPVRLVAPRVEIVLLHRSHSFNAPPTVFSLDAPVRSVQRPETPPANYVVHVYEHKKFTRTIERPFTAEDAEAFATEFNRTSKNYGRWALSGKNDAKPKKVLD